MVVVTHGPELHAFAKENYKKYQGIMDRMKELADDGVESGCATMRCARPASRQTTSTASSPWCPPVFQKSCICNHKDRNINPLPYSVKGVRKLDQPGT